MNMLAAATDPATIPRMWRSLLLVTLVWGAIYLPRLGSLELKSEEGRRVLPAVTMLQTGNYIVPQVGSEPYLRTYADGTWNNNLLAQPACPASHAVID